MTYTLHYPLLLKGMLLITYHLYGSDKLVITNTIASLLVITAEADVHAHWGYSLVLQTLLVHFSWPSIYGSQLHNSDELYPK